MARARCQGAHLLVVTRIRDELNPRRRSHVIEEYGKLDGLVAITGTLNVGAVMEGLQRWNLQHQSPVDAFPFHLPTVFECFWSNAMQR
jgi:Peptidase family S58